MKAIQSPLSVRTIALRDYCLLMAILHSAVLVGCQPCKQNVESSRLNNQHPPLELVLSIISGVDVEPVYGTELVPSGAYATLSMWNRGTETVEISAYHMFTPVLLDENGQGRSI